MIRSLPLTTFLLTLCVSGACVNATASAEEQRFQRRAEKGTDQERLEIRAEIVEDVVRKVLQAQGLMKAFPPEGRQDLLAKGGKLLKDERFSERRGTWRYKVKLDPDAVLDLIVASQSGGVKGVRFVLAIDLHGKSEAEKKRLVPLVRAAATNHLTRSGGLVVDGDPKTAPKGALVLTLKIGTKLHPFKSSSPQAVSFVGRLQSRSTNAQVYDRATQTVRARTTLRSLPEKHETRESSSSGVASPLIPKGADLAKHEGDYYAHLATWLTRGLVVRLNADATAGPAKAAPAAPAKGEHKLRLRGYTEGELERIRAALKTCGATKIKDRGQLGVAYRFTFETAGEGSALLRKVLTEAKLKGEVKVKGNVISVVEPKLLKPRPRPQPAVRQHTAQVRFKGFSQGEVARIQKQLESHPKVKKTRAMGKVRAFDVFSLTLVEKTEVLLKEVLEKAGCKGKIQVSPMATIVTKQ